MSDIAKVADFPMVLEIERHNQNHDVYKVELDMHDHGQWFRTLLYRRTDYRVVTRSNHTPIYYIAKHDKQVGSGELIHG